MTSSVITLRPVRDGDEAALLALARASGGGMTSLPEDGDALTARVERSVQGLQRLAGRGGAGEPPLSLYLLAEREGVPLGSVALFALSGSGGPFVTYRLATAPQAFPALGKAFAHEILEVSTAHRTSSELAALFVSPAGRGLSLGRALVTAAIAFCRHHREAFADILMAEMRGWVGPSGDRPFWDDIVMPFFGMSFLEADHLNATAGNAFIEALLPAHPLYLSLLPPRVREIVGVPHPDGRAALALLQQEGLSTDGHFDPFDLGPCLSAPLDDLAARQERALAAGANRTDGGRGRGLWVEGRGAEFRCRLVPQGGTTAAGAGASHPGAPEWLPFD
ncbi:arginine/ornithine N-succinyltransferase beta subunit [Parvularcula bermudensis HTCC2503]|uniref:Arginine/ornithine N-succinyltransferase beta subunit n=1 Tax=Parvularcula bermudensis (strain ATCC BAA-594 / HTCC2503 / KCTC 12087) TaxID=314260 RepID=E0TBJ0_PARBH|nr:GNAT family N-acetyltransferase [Parvularcula bermudensis]ADM08365.1 arginine/ornithine N-succinyltransferase beta subunit [Parvularcula bermudensis HTCC2503]